MSSRVYPTEARQPFYAAVGVKGDERSKEAGRKPEYSVVEMAAGVLASLAELELELGSERRVAAREARLARGRDIGRPKVLDKSKAALAQRMQVREHDWGRRQT
jgi:DNA invertase Pin-like site-specific DNA recombinase